MSTRRTACSGCSRSRSPPVLFQQLRAARLAARFIDGQARSHDWLLPEHYDLSWQPMLEYNRNRLDDPFRPYGATIGHSLEWSRLVVCAGGGHHRNHAGRTTRLVEAMSTDASGAVERAT